MVGSCPQVHCEGMAPRSSPTSDGNAPAEVVAGLINDGSAEAVAQAAVDLSFRHGAPIRFVHVVPPGTPESAIRDAKDVVFAEALRSLRHGDRQRVTFESPRGDAGPTLVQRSRHALVLVVGEDKTEDPEPSRGISSYCLAHAHCHVLVVASQAQAVRQDSRQDV